MVCLKFDELLRMRFAVHEVSAADHLRSIEGIESAVMDMSRNEKYLRS